MSIDIIIARGKGEDIGWIEGIAPAIRRVIYEPKDVERDVGREAGVFLQHIIKEWDRLATINIFTQATPIEHCPDFIERVNDIEFLMKKRSYIGLSDMRCVFDETGFPHHPGLPIRSFFSALWPGRNMPPGWVAWMNGMFAVTGERIRRSGKERYMQILDLIGYAPLTQECYCLERFWGVVFE